ncbi:MULTISPECIES: hypothetical protein [Hyphomonas]|uniref:hypothetical protein n=1 Tax=Hyphomonas TaxID=85 RepID=UPI00054F503D|nr:MULTISPECIES: hypothetical protein [Hyphomonas]
MIRGILKLAAGAGLLVTAVACDGQPGRPDTGRPGPLAAKPETRETLKAEQFRSWAVADRAAFLAGRIVAADMLFRAGEVDAARAQIAGTTQRLSAADDGALEALGFEPARVEALVVALELGRPEEEVAPLFADAESNLKAVLAASGAAPEDVTAFLMQLSADAYQTGVKFGDIVDAQAYQSAYGYAVTGRDLISPLDEMVYGELRLELDILVLMWPAGGPLPDRTPAPEVRMVEQFGRIKAALQALP